MLQPRQTRLLLALLQPLVTDVFDGRLPELLGAATDRAHHVDTLRLDGQHVGRLQPPALHVGVDLRQNNERRHHH